MVIINIICEMKESLNLKNIKMNLIFKIDLNRNFIEEMVYKMSLWLDLVNIIETKFVYY